MTQEMTDFIVIDDDPVNNRICKIIIERVYPGKQITCFTEPEQGLKFIADAYHTPGSKQAIMLLDINMPVLSGWDVLNRLEEMPKDIIDRFTIYILSSSVDAYDKKKAGDSKLVSGYIEKPLTMDRVKSFFET